LSNTVPNMHSLTSHHMPGITHTSHIHLLAEL